MIAIAPIDDARKRTGFLPVSALTTFSAKGVTILDPFSTLISSDVEIGPDVTLWPGTILQASDGGHIRIGEGCALYPATRMIATGGQIDIGARSEIGEEGGFTLKAEKPDQSIHVGRGARLLGGGSLTLDNRIGDGAQILGPIRVQNCILGPGGTHRDPEPDLRGAVLKGSGVARGLEVPTGMVIQAFGLFSEAPLRQQSWFHPKAGS